MIFNPQPASPTNSLPSDSPVPSRDIYTPSLPPRGILRKPRTESVSPQIHPNDYPQRHGSLPATLYRQAPSVASDAEFDRQIAELPRTAPASCLSPGLSTSRAVPLVWDLQTTVYTLGTMLSASGLKIGSRLDIDEIVAMAECDDMDREKRLRFLRNPPQKDANLRLYGVPVRQVSLYASVTKVIGKHEHQIPVVVYASVEQLRKNGIRQPGLFTSPGNRRRLAQLIDVFDTAEHAFGDGFSLALESPHDVCALLTTYIHYLPEPLLSAGIFDALWDWCVCPTSAQREAGHKVRQPAVPASKSRLLGYLAAWSRSKSEQHADAVEVQLAALLLRLLPSSALGLLLYLLAFFADVPAHPENGCALGDVASEFADALLGCGAPHLEDRAGDAQKRARKVMLWLLVRWERVRAAVLDRESLPATIHAPGPRAPDTSVPSDGRPALPGQTPSPAAHGRLSSLDNTVFNVGLGLRSEHPPLNQDRSSARPSPLAREPAVLPADARQSAHNLPPPLEMPVAGLSSAPPSPASSDSASLLEYYERPKLDTVRTSELVYDPVEMGIMAEHAHPDYSLAYEKRAPLVSMESTSSIYSTDSAPSHTPSEHDYTASSEHQHTPSAHHYAPPGLDSEVAALRKQLADAHRRIAALEPFEQYALSEDEVRATARHAQAAEQAARAWADRAAQLEARNAVLEEENVRSLELLRRMRRASRQGTV